MVVRYFVCLLAALWLVQPACSAEPSLGIESLVRLDRLPTFKRSIRVASQSSYDRTGGNNDGFSGQYSYVRKEEDGLVLLDVEGPGVLHRIWTPTPTEDIVEFYFDGETKPRLSLPFHELFSGASDPFVRPLVGSGAGGFFSYVPLPFAESCKVLIKAEQMRFYQINYSIYPEETKIASFSWPPSAEYLEQQQAAQALFGSSGKDISSYTAVDSEACRVHRTVNTLASGSSCTLFETKEPGRIVGLRLGPASAFAGKDRGIVLRAYWDNDSQPAVLAPVGDLFGYAWGKPACRSLLVGTAEDTNYLYFPMPYDQAAKIELVSEQTAGEPVEIQAEIVTDPTPRAADEGKFYALWRRENPTTKGKPFTFIETEGQGHLVGCFQQSQGFESGTTYFFEGDDQTTIDDELTIHGTGSEDFYNGGWYDVPDRWEKQLSFPLSGCLGYKKHLGRSGGYRLMLGDAYAFRKSILQTIEHSPTGNEVTNDYCGLTLLYAAERPTCAFELPPLEDRTVVDLQRLVFSVWWNTPIYAWSFENAALKR
ncbi:MAG: DUF2961 domain-containing protein, partial [Planctomycetales bacterium]|nr:DUF2961 domain-containing protein [Planctomycetales bacterium]